MIDGIIKEEWDKYLSANLNLLILDHCITVISKFLPSKRSIKCNFAGILMAGDY